MGKRTKPSIDLATGFASSCGSNSRDSYLNQQRVLDSIAIRDLQGMGFDKGQATAMIDPKRGSRCRGIVRSHAL